MVVGKVQDLSWHFIDKKILNNIPEKIVSTRKVMIDKKGHAISGKMEIYSIIIHLLLIKMILQVVMFYLFYQSMIMNMI